LARIIAISISLFLSTVASGAGDVHTGLDVVVIIDHSGSMWGNPAAHPEANDPWEHRVGAAQDLIMRLAQHTERNANVHRVSIIGFGTKVDVDLPPYEIRFDPAYPDATVRAAKQKAESAIQSKEMKYTNTSGALELAHERFDIMKQMPSQGARRRIALLITDGRPTLGEAHGKGPAYMRPLVREEVKQLRASGIELWVIGIEDSSDVFWHNGDGRFWEELCGPEPGRASLADPTAIGLGNILTAYVQDWLGTEAPPPVGNSYICPPYQSRLVFYATFQTQRAFITIYDPLGNALPKIGGDANAIPGTFAHLNVRNPEPGEYTIHRDPTQTFPVYAEAFPPAVQRLSPMAGTAMGLPTTLAYKLSQDKQRPIDIRKGWPLDTSILVRLAGDTATTEIPAAWQGKGAFSGQWTPPVAGTFELAFRAIATMPDGATVTIVGIGKPEAWTKVEVAERYP